MDPWLLEVGPPAIQRFPIRGDFRTPKSCQQKDIGGNDCHVLLSHSVAVDFSTFLSSWGSWLWALGALAHGLGQFQLGDATLMSKIIREDQDFSTFQQNKNHISHGNCYKWCFKQWDWEPCYAQLWHKFCTNGIIDRPSAIVFQLAHRVETMQHLCLILPSPPWTASWQSLGGPCGRP